MKPFFLFLLLIGTGILFGILARPVGYLAALCRMPRNWFARLSAKRPTLQLAGFSGSSSSLRRSFPRHAAHFHG